MTSSKRILSLILTMLMIPPILAACDHKGPAEIPAETPATEPTTGGETEDATEPSTEETELGAESFPTDSPFAFSDGAMTADVLRAYCSRAVTLAGFCMEGIEEDPIFEEDLRMLLNVGAKFVGRAAYYSWSGYLTKKQVESHFAKAAERAKAAHEADPEMILQAGVFEIIYDKTVNAIPIPAYVFEAFGLTPEKRNFKYADMVFKTGQYAESNNYWGISGSAVPDITQTETQMYFYWMISQYIDAGFESIHLGQAELMARYSQPNFKHWDTVTTLARAYAKEHARRGLVLFDCHTAIDSAGMKVGNRLICDMVGAGLVPSETYHQDGAYQCEVTDYYTCWLSWVGRSHGGRHPLGFDVEQNFTLMEFDNYGGNGNPNVSTPDAFYNWGYDDITWYALQPSWYRDQFLVETDEFLKKTELSSKGEQQYFLQPACRRVLTARPEPMTYTVQEKENMVEILILLQKEQVQIKRDGLTMEITVTKDYRANNPSDACPHGFGQEDTIRKLFLGEE